MRELRFPCRRLGSISPWDQERERERRLCLGSGEKEEGEEELSQRVYSNTFFPFLSALHFPVFFLFGTKIIYFALCLRGPFRGRGN